MADDDGGLDDILASRARQRDVARAADLTGDVEFARAVDVALSTQDAHCVDAVRAFMRRVDGVTPTFTFTRRREQPPSGFLRRRPAVSFEEVPDGHAILTRRVDPAEHTSHERKVAVRRHGQVILWQRDHGPRFRDAPTITPVELLHGFPPRATVACATTRNGHWETIRVWSRAHDAPPGALPFYRNPERAGYEDELVSLRWLDVRVGPETASQLIAATTEWFVATLADYIEAAS